MSFLFRLCEIKVLAFILIATASCSSYEVRDHLRKIKAVKEAEVTLGQYDVMVKAEIADSKALGKLVFEEIRSMECVISTTSLTVHSEKREGDEIDAYGIY